MLDDTLDRSSNYLLGKIKELNIELKDDIEKSVKNQLKEKHEDLKKDIHGKLNAQHEELQEIKNYVEEIEKKLEAQEQMLEIQEQKIKFLDDRDKDRHYHSPPRYEKAVNSSYAQTGHGFSSARRKADHPFDR